MGSNLNGYTAAEDAVIREAYGSLVTLKSQMHRLPGRSYDAAVQRALYLGLSRKTLMDRVHELMADGKPRTAAEIEKALGGRRKYILDQMRLATNGVDYHIDSYVGVGRNFVFKAGPGVNAVRPEPMHTPMKVYQRRRRERRRDDAPVKVAVKRSVRPKVDPKPKRVAVDDRTKDEQYRLPDTRWPQYDLTAFHVITSMVRDARQSV
ncbi:hypothetical protein R69746_05632 [Paraburkholderia aspalathi]|uniref:hypothetical protein n=1 Tax=Paraburkholderia aspalathi TaxID=1324617 RepID=UPI00190AB8F3|nr:hypothetical protein [Paraburkholderia aspalathi]MBK3841745.1 hypothetical protein [Paraburkholderia aspalathi]CAE6811300.1 hypothetical protein R69746_05632 [Paraburkholderia aspalathi]